jgi:hypothetical protein
MRPQRSLRGLAVLLVACCLFVGHAAARSLIVNTGYELHAALASPDISVVYVARNVSRAAASSLQQQQQQQELAADQQHRSVASTCAFAAYIYKII